MFGRTYVELLDDAAARLIEEHWAIAELGTARIRDLPYGAERDALLRGRRAAGLFVRSEDLILVRIDGSSLAAHELPLVRRLKVSRARTEPCTCRSKIST